MQGVRSDYAIGKYAVGESSMLYYEKNERFDGTSRLVIGTHGHNGDSTQYLQIATFLGKTVSALVKTGRYIFMAIDASGGVAWSNPAAMSDIDSAVTYGRSIGAKTGKYGLIGYSMGALTVLNKLKRDSANLAAVWAWAPPTDLDWAYSTTGHTPKANNATYTSEIDAAFGSYANTAGYRIWDDAATFKNLGVKTMIAHATNDSVVPYSLTTSFMASLAGGDGKITERQPVITTGDHTALFPNVTDQEFVAHFDAGSW